MTQGKREKEKREKEKRVKDKKIIRLLLDLCYPPRCPICDKILKFGRECVCESCLRQIRFISEPLCMKCGKPLEEEKEYCKDCAGNRHFYHQGAAVFEYQSISASLYRFKYKGRQEYAEFYGRCMARKLEEQFRCWRPQALIPVPVHPSRKRRRGYNQAEIIARALSSETGIPMRNDLIKRVKKTLPQKELNSSERQNNLKKAFKICKNDVKLDTIIIIDDIYTTGSTVDAVASAFLACGVRRIYAVSLAIGHGV